MYYTLFTVAGSPQIWLLDMILGQVLFLYLVSEPARSGQVLSFFFVRYLSQVGVVQVRFFSCLVSWARYAVWKLMVKNVYVVFERLFRYLDQKLDTKKTDFQ